MGKFGYMLIGALFTFILSFSYLVLADSFNADPYSKDTSTTITSENDNGTFHGNHKDELEEAVVVQEEPVIIVAKHQQLEELSQGSGENVNKGIMTPQDEMQEMATEEVHFSEEEDQTQLAKQGEPSAFLNRIEKLEIKIKNDDLEVKIKQEQKKKKDKAEVEIKHEKEKMKMKGKKADDFLAQTFSSVQLNNPEDLQQVVKNIITSYGYDWDSVEVEIKVESKDNKYEYKHKL